MKKYYYVYPIAYKIFSINNLTKLLYRKIANIAGSLNRTKTAYSIDQERILLRLIKDFCRINNEDRFIELGTGWTHRYAMFIRIFFKNPIALYDVIDNRQFLALKDYFHKVEKLLTDDEKAIKDNSIDVFRDIKRINTFSELYRIAKFEYYLEKSGGFTKFNNDTYTVAFSCNVFEHISSSLLTNGYLNDLFRIIKPGGYSIQIIDISDHLHVMDPHKTHIKEYLKISNKLWTKYFQSDIKYTNRLQKSDWLRLFKQAGFNLIHVEEVKCDITDLQISDYYKKYSIDDLECRRLFLIHQKPLNT